MPKYVVTEVDGDAAPEGSLESLPAARVIAQRRARASERPVVILQKETGQEIARYHPPRPTEPTEVKAVIARLKGATDRMQGILQKKPSRRRPTAKK
jgi:hypothetical protein